MIALMSKLVRKLDRMMFRVIPSCKEAMEMHSRALDDGLPWPRRFLLEAHCMMCDYCQRYGEQLRWMQAKMREMPSRMDFSKVKAMPGEMRQRIAKRLSEQT